MINISVPSFYLYLPGWRGTEETMKSPRGFCISFHHGIPNIIFSSLHRTGPNYLISVADLFSMFFATYWFFFSIPCKMCFNKETCKTERKKTKKENTWITHKCQNSKQLMVTWFWLLVPFFSFSTPHLFLGFLFFLSASFF